MLIFVAGLRTPATLWCERVMEALLKRAGIKPAMLRVASAGEAMRGVLGTQGSTVLASPRPDNALGEAIVNSGAPFLFVSASPQASVSYLAAEADLPPIELVRDVMTDLACLVPLAQAGNALLVAENAPSDGPTWIQAMARHFDLDCSAPAAAEIARSISAIIAGAAPPIQLSSNRALSTATTDKDGEDAACLRGLLSGSSNTMMDGLPGPVIVTRRMFRVADSGQFALQPIDVTGRSRILVFGPHLPLPSGDWTARCVYAFSADLVGSPMSLDIVYFNVGYRELARTTFNVTSAGRLEVNLGFSHSEPAALIEVRLFCNHAVFDGTVSVGFVEFRPGLRSDMSFEASALSAG